MLIARDNQTHFLNALKLITVAAKDAKLHSPQQALGAAESPGELAWRYALEWMLSEEQSSAKHPHAKQAVDSIVTVR